MKNITKNLSLLLLVILCLGSCKKDAFTVNDGQKEFVQVNSGITFNPNNFIGGGVDLILKPNGKAYFNPSGDILWEATYKVVLRTIIVKVNDTNTKYVFTITSDEEIHGQYGAILKLVKN